MTDLLSAQRYARATITKIVGPNDADDVLQDAALRAWRHIEQYREEAAFTSWFYKIALNEAKMHLRARHGQVRGVDKEWLELSDVYVSNEPSPEQLAIDAERSARLYDAISRLNRRRKLAALEWLAGEPVGPGEAKKAARHKAKLQLREMLA